MNTALPSVNQRIYDLIQEKSKGNVSQFCKKLGIEKPQKINRLFKADKRSGKYPTPSSDILTLISNTFDISLDNIVKGNSKSSIAEETRPAPYGDERWIDHNLSLVENLEKVISFRKEGMITEEEFARIKKKIIPQD